MRRQYAEVASDVTPWRRNDGGKARDEGMSGEHNPFHHRFKAPPPGDLFARAFAAKAAVIGNVDPTAFLRGQKTQGVTAKHRHSRRVPPPSTRRRCRSASTCHTTGRATKAAAAPPSCAARATQGRDRWHTEETQPRMTATMPTHLRAWPAGLMISHRVCARTRVVGDRSTPRDNPSW